MSISRTSPPVWRQARTLAILFWTGFGCAPLAALLLLIGDSGFPIKVALILGLGSVVLIGLSVVLRSDAGTVERDLYAALADSEAETKRALADLRGELRRKAIGHEPAPPAVAAAPQARELPRPAEEPRRPRPIQQANPEYLPPQPGRRGADEREPAYLPETTAVPRQRWEDERPAGYETERRGDDRGERRNGAARRGQSVEAWRAEETAPEAPAHRGGGTRHPRAVEDGWSDEVYNSGPQPRASRANGSDRGRRGRHHREPDELDGVIPARRYREDEDSGEIPTRRDAPSVSTHQGANARRREYASGEPRTSGEGGGGSYMDTYYGEKRR